MKQTSENLFNDIDLAFIPHPITGDLSKLKNADAVDVSVKNILLTFKGERPFNPDFGSKINGLLFEPVSTMIQQVLADEIQISIENWEPRVSINTVRVLMNSSEDGYDVSIDYNIINDFTDLTIDIFLNRLR